jgi:hypothetical protein
MARPARDPGLDTLLDLDGQTFFVDESGQYWVKFDVKECEVSTERPHGLRYSLTLHDRSGRRIVGFDNAHGVAPATGPSGRSRRRLDHKHRLRTIRPYEYHDAATLLGDFWAEVDAVLKENGVLK